jgi:lipoprotein-anchoring transpeptidase ErfK/SrfK
MPRRPAEVDAAMRREGGQVAAEPAQSAKAETQQHGMLSPRPAQRSRGLPPWRDPAAVALVVVLALLLTALACASFWLYSRTRVHPGVETLGLPLGGQTRQAAAATLEEAWGERTVALLAGERARWLRATELGLWLDAERTAEAALAIGDPWTHLLALVAEPTPAAVEPVVGIDEAQLRRALEALAPEVLVPAIDATLRVYGGRAEATPSFPGRALDVPVTAERIATNLSQVVEGAPVPMAFVEVAPAIPDLTALAEEANARLANPLRIRAYDPVRDETLWWTPSLETWSQWLTIEIAVGSVQLAWGVDHERVWADLEAWAATLAPERYVDLAAAVDATVATALAGAGEVEFRVYHHPSQHVVELGETLVSIAEEHGFPYPWLQQANPGVDALRPGQVIQIPSPDVLLPLPVVTHKRIVVSISQQQMWAIERGELVWQWTVSTGIASSPTSPGVFQVQSHELNAYASSWDLWMPHFIGIYRPVPSSSFENGFHGFPTRDGVNLLWTSSLGHPVTYGCILLSNQNAAALYDWAEPGVVVEIQR